MIKGDAGMESIYTWDGEGKHKAFRGATGKGDGVHVLTGPIFVAGAEPGDVLKVRV
jgi:acetamidase/formamidase